MGGMIPVQPPRPLDPRLINLPPHLAANLNKLPTQWITELLKETTK